MKKTVFFIALMVIGCTACTKKMLTDPTTKVEGRLMDRGTNIPIPNTAVKLIEVTSNFPNLPTLTPIQTVTSDANGQYAFTFEWTDGSKSYELDVRPKDLDKYYDLPKVVGTIDKGQTNKIDCFLYPYGWVKYRVRNINPFDDRDTIRCLAGVFTGKNVDKTIIVKQLKLWEIQDSSYWSVTKNNVFIRFSKLISLSPKDTINFDINY
jgi:hypothetical protein